MKQIRTFSRAAFLATIALAMIPPLAADARLIIKEKTKNYKVSGRTGKQIHAKFGRGGPISIRKKHAIAATKRVLNFDGIRFTQRGDRCVMAKRDIRIDLTYYYPQWTNKKRGSKEVQQSWNRFMKELIKHEKVHGKLFKEGARAMEKKLAQISKRSYRTCQAMRSATLKEVKTIMRRNAAKHIAFDRREKRSTTRIRKLERAFLLSK